MVWADYYKDNPRKSVKEMLSPILSEVAIDHRMYGEPDALSMGFSDGTQLETMMDDVVRRMIDEIYRMGQDNLPSLHQIRVTLDTHGIHYGIFNPNVQ